MNHQKSLDEKIRNLKDRIADARDYISSDFCIQCVEVYKQIAVLEQEIKRLENERNR
jgi:hypothetical protein